MGVVVHTGAREDPVGRTGLTHMLEHLVEENVPDMTRERYTIGCRWLNQVAKEKRGQMRLETVWHLYVWKSRRRLPLYGAYLDVLIACTCKTS